MIVGRETDACPVHTVRVSVSAQQIWRAATKDRHDDVGTYWWRRCRPTGRQCGTSTASF